MSFAQRRQDPVLRASRAGARFRGKVHFFISDLRRGNNHVNGRMFLSLLRYVLPAHAFRVRRRTISMVVYHVHFTPEIRTFRFFLRLFVGPKKELHPSRDHVYVCPREVRDYRYGLFITTFWEGPVSQVIPPPFKERGTRLRSTGVKRMDEYRPVFRINRRTVRYLFPLRLRNACLLRVIAGAVYGMGPQVGTVFQSVSWPMWREIY